MIVGPWKSRRHGLLRTVVAGIGSVLIVLLAGVAAARRLPLEDDLAFAVGYLGTFLLWPVVAIGLVRASSGRRALVWGVGAVVVLGGLALV